MANDKTSRLVHLEEAINKEILAASDDEIMKDAHAAGDDVAAFAARMNQWLDGARLVANKARLARAREDLERDRLDGSAEVVSLPIRRRGSTPRGLVPDTMAARHGKNLSDRDKAAFDDDFDELFDDDAWGDGKDDEDR